MTKFIFFGRLVQEKGIEMILEAFTQLHVEGVQDWHLDIYGIGGFDMACNALAVSLPQHVTFHGRGDHHHVMKVLKEKDFCLMPSLIIETFGLTALESLRAGVPVIGFKKGGTEPFIREELNIESQPGKNDTEKLLHILRHILSSEKDKSHYLPHVDFNNYSPEKWVSNFRQIAGDAKRILIVSDFIKKVGGVENYIRDAKELLEENGYVVQMWGVNKKNSFRGLFKTALNISGWRKLRKKISHFQPDIVWCNSVMRELGRLPLKAIPQKTKLFMMFHDMGYFYPYTSYFTSLDHLPKDTSLRERIRVSGRKNMVTKILLTLKRFSLRCLKSVIRSHNTTYLAPGAFMKKPIEKSWAKDDQNVVILPHFVR